MKSYKLYIARPLLIFYLFMFGIVELIGIVGLIVAATGKLGPDGPPVWVFFLLVCAVSFASYMWLRFPFEIRVHDDTNIEFRGLFRTMVISLTEIKSVRAKLYALGFVDVVHQRGTVHLLNQMDGFHDFIATIKSINPGVEIKGC
jgi:uncharacterized membrane protein